MRELTEIEAQSVVGGGAISEYAAEGSAIGSVVGYFGESTMAGAARGGFVGAMLGASFGGGFIVGSYLYDSYQNS